MLRVVPQRVKVGQLAGGVHDDAAIVGAEDGVVGSKASDVEVVQQMPANEIWANMRRKAKANRSLLKFMIVDAGGDEGSLWI